MNIGNLSDKQAPIQFDKLTIDDVYKTLYLTDPLVHAVLDLHRSYPDQVTREQALLGIILHQAQHISRLKDQLIEGHLRAPVIYQVPIDSFKKQIKRGETNGTCICNTK